MEDFWRKVALVLGASACVLVGCGASEDQNTQQLTRADNS
jgi:hypothetical protein